MENILLHPWQQNFLASPRPRGPLCCSCMGGREYDVGNPLICLSLSCLWPGLTFPVFVLPLLRWIDDATWLRAARRDDRGQLNRPQWTGTDAAVSFARAQSLLPPPSRKKKPRKKKASQCACLQRAADSVALGSANEDGKEHVKSSTSKELMAVSYAVAGGQPPARGSGVRASTP